MDNEKEQKIHPFGWVVIGGIILLAIIPFGSDQASDQTTSSSIRPESSSKYFGDYKCTQDCGGHEAGYEWAEEKGINRFDDCGGKSESFIEGCLQYVHDQY